MSNTQLAPAQQGMVARQEFGAQQLAVQAETASTAVAAQASATVQARYIMAERKPRDWDQVRMQLMKECMRPGFAKSALYAKPVGGGKEVTGFSIRFAEAALRCMTNMLPETSTIYDDSRKRILKVSVTDLENNVTFAAELTIEKTVERKQLKKGQHALGSRLNSYGEPTYLVEATEGDLLNKEGASVSKAMRNLALRLLPGDIADDCKAQIYSTLTSEVAKDPDAERKKVADAFAMIGVQPKDLSEYLGHDLGKVSPAEIVELRNIYSAIRDGETTWPEVIESKSGKTSSDEAPAMNPQTNKAREMVEKKLQAQREKAAPASKKQEEPEPWLKHLKPDTGDVQEEKDDE